MLINGTRYHGGGDIELFWYMEVQILPLQIYLTGVVSIFLKLNHAEKINFVQFDMYYQCRSNS